jgi:hypothetical protein
MVIQWNVFFVCYTMFDTNLNNWKKLYFLRLFHVQLTNCRGKSYINSNNITVIYTGLQGRITQLNPVLNHVLCAAHSVNLTGAHAAQFFSEGSSFFGVVQYLHTFFVVSTPRWYHLSNLKPYTKVLKRVDGARSVRNASDKCLPV